MPAIRPILFARVASPALALGLIAGIGCAPAFAQEKPAADDGGEIIVTGARQALRDAISEKLSLNNAAETLHANDVGKLPDQNVAEALKRLPGLSVANDQGEGRYIIIRGIDPNLINVAINGQTMPAPEPAGRQVKLDDIPSGMIQSVVVTKSLLPSQDANAIGGEVNIRTKTAFDEKNRFFLDARGSAGWYDLNHKTPFELDGTVGGRFGAEEQFGAVVSVNYSRRPINSENFQGTSVPYDRNGGVPDGNGLRDYNLMRTRLGIVGNFDWHPTDGVKLYIRSSYSKFEDNETRDQNRLAVTSTAGGASALKATGTILVRHREEDDNTKSVTLGGEFELGGGKLEMSGGWTKAVKLDPIRSEFTFTTAKGAVNASFDASTNPYTLVPSGSSAGLFNSATPFTFSKANYETRQAYEQIWQGRADYSHPVALGDDSSVAIGFKYLDRHKFNNQDRTDYKAGTAAWNIGTVAYFGESGFYGNQFQFGQRIGYDAALAYLRANPTASAVDNAGTISDSLASDYDVREEIVAGYAMATLKFGGLTLIPGVRVEHTRDRTAATVANALSKLTDSYNSFGSKSYTDVFPGLNAKYELEKNLYLRGAVTTSIGRPNYAILASSVLVTPGTPDLITLGNPDLKPYKAVNFDASVEYYPTPDSLFSAGFFHKEIDNPIYNSGFFPASFTVGASTYTKPSITQPVNAKNETVTGIEFNAQTQFTMLPGFFSGFGISANYTHVWGHANGGGINGLRTGDLPLNFQSSNVANAQIFYEKYGVTARLAFNYRSAYLDTLNQADAGLDQYTDGNGQLDFHLSYQVIPQVTVFGDAINLTDAPWRRYIGSKDFLVEREHYGVSLRGGVQVHL